MNQVILVGRLAKEPEISELENNRKKCVVTLAVGRPYRNSDGIYEADFINCILWNAVALNTFEYCHTGDTVGIKGRLQTRSYEDEEKNKKFILEVIVEKVTFLTSAKKPENEE